MSTNKPDPVVHMSELEKQKLELKLEMEKLRGEILRWMLVQTLTLVGAMTALKLFG